MVLSDRLHQGLQLRASRLVRELSTATKCSIRFLWKHLRAISGPAGWIPVLLRKVCMAYSVCGSQTAQCDSQEATGARCSMTRYSSSSATIALAITSARTSVISRAREGRAPSQRSARGQRLLRGQMIRAGCSNASFNHAILRTLATNAIDAAAVFGIRASPPCRRHSLETFSTCA